jgi:hypothetical protein
MPIRFLAAFAALACAPALHAQEIVLRPDLLVPSVDTMYTVQVATGDTVATAVQGMRRVTADGRELWEVAYMFSGGTDIHMVDTTTFDAQTLLPVRQVRRGGDQRIVVEYGPPVRVATTRAGVAASPAWTRDFGRPVYAGSVMDVVYRALPLEDGYQARIPFVLPQPDDLWWFEVQVTGPTTLQTREGPVEAWRVKTTPAQAQSDVLWISREGRRLLRVDHVGGMRTIR